MPLTVGVLALQGDVREHLEVIGRLGANSISVKTVADLRVVDGLIIPGGESTTISKLLNIFGLFKPLADAISQGLPMFGTCAGLILLSKEILDSASGQMSFSAIDVSVRRNAFGHQGDSFEVDIPFVGIENEVHAAFIRAPIVERVGTEVQVLSKLNDGRVVAVRQNNVLGISFHPEVTGEDRIHSYFLQMIESQKRLKGKISED